MLVSQSFAQPLSNDEVDLLAKLQKRADAQKDIDSPPTIVTQGASVKIQLNNNAHVGYTIGDKDTIQIDEIPDSLRGYTQATMEALALGYNLCAGGKNQSESVEILKLKYELEADITTLSESVNQQITAVKTQIQSAGSAINSLETGSTETEKEVESLGDTVEKMLACIKDKTVLGPDGKCTTTYKHCDFSKVKTPNNGTVSGHALLPGTSMTFGCDEGFIVNGSSITTCKSDGTFSDKTPVCSVFNTLGSNRANAAESCLEIKENFPNAKSGKFWVIDRAVFCEMEKNGGGWTLISKANKDRKSDQHLADNDVNVKCLTTDTLDCAGTHGNKFRLQVTKSKQMWFQCGNFQKFARNTCNSRADDWWSGGCTCACWGNAYNKNADAYSISSAPDCGPPTCNGPSFKGRNWGRRGQNGCGLGSSYGQSGMWWVK